MKIKYKFMIILLVLGTNIFSQENNESYILLSGTKWLVTSEDEDAFPPHYEIEFLENGIIFDRYPNDGHYWQQDRNIIIIYWSQNTAKSICFFVSEKIITGSIKNVNGYYGKFKMERIEN
jgi:hypothetical protein